MLYVHLDGILVLAACLTTLWLQTAIAADLGVTGIESYLVNTTIATRFARTAVVAKFRNDRDCSALRGFTLQLPLNARVRSFSMKLSDGCKIDSKLASEQDAEKSFKDQVKAGKPAALLTAWDSENYRVDVLVPSLGTTLLEVHYDELLTRTQGEVVFQVPVSPGVEVGKLEVNLFVNEPQTGISKFSLEDPGYGNFEVARDDNTANGRIQLDNVPSNSTLPRLLRGVYDTNSFEENGLLMADGYGCATLLFNPEDFLQTGAMPRNIAFVIDVSGSMKGQKLSDAQKAFSAMITTLAVEDYFAIQSFSSSGTESVFESRAASIDAKSAAITFVNDLIAGGGTNLNDAYTHGLDRIMTMEQTRDQDREYVPVLVILTDGQATAGKTGSQQISKAVRAKNEINAKIFALSFGVGADLSLLLGISVQNGGMAIQIYEGFDDAAQQMEGFFLGQLGEILMSDIEVGFGGDFGILDQTMTKFPVFARGTEIVSRVMMAESDFSLGTLQATTKANTVVGERIWTTVLEMETVVPTLNSECAIGLAHARIAEIMQFREGALSLGDNLIGYEPYPQTGGNYANKAEEAKEAALKIALENGVMWPTLTAMVTVPGSGCDIAVNNDYCTDGDSSNPSTNGQEDEVYDSGNKQSGGTGGSSGTTESSSYADVGGQITTVSTKSDGGCCVLCLKSLCLVVSLALTLQLSKE